MGSRRDKLPILDILAKYQIDIVPVLNLVPQLNSRVSLAESNGHIQFVYTRAGIHAILARQLNCRFLPLGQVVYRYFEVPLVDYF